MKILQLFKAARICTNPTGEIFFYGSMKEPIEMVLEIVMRRITIKRVDLRSASAGT